MVSRGTEPCGAGHRRWLEISSDSILGAPEPTLQQPPCPGASQKGSRILPGFNYSITIKKQIHINTKMGKE